MDAPKAQNALLNTVNLLSHPFGVLSRYPHGYPSTSYTIHGLRAFIARNCIRSRPYDSSQTPYTIFRASCLALQAFPYLTLYSNIMLM